ncbi:MAG TPA: amidohydrolase, partial [Thermoanaerobaculia bacterium]|nr:amidohydrolase [Thermoanaerobaculia bacterium]
MKSRFTLILLVCLAIAAIVLGGAPRYGAVTPEDPPPPEEEPVEEEEPPVREEHPPGGQIPEAVAEQKEDEKEDETEEKWDVSNPPAPSFQAAIDVTEGTWLSLDVSPDGTEIVFDLLGDIYTMPIGGGDARNLTRGVEWDMQPVFSPDGEWIAFTSDRSGGDNIWIMKRDGSDPQQVTKETFRLLNSPSWTPDGQFIVARKHFTSRRSLGAGEMWLYHRSGGEGLQMTKKPNEQKDAGEPVFSPDGRYLYFSQDTTPGAFFEYNKDPSSQIYVIQRLDRQTGEIDSFVTGSGGAVRPTPSPDGKRLAFVRRIRYDTVLHVIDLESGKITPIHDALERDMQETWAIHGVYPRMAWTPDNRSLVFWAGGKFHRIDVESRQVTPIPFRVRDERQMYEVVRFPIEVAPERFDVRMLRWVEVSPDGKQVVYEALGHLWIRDLPEGTPRRLTRQRDHFESYPAWSRDGKFIVYVTWDDQKLGSVRVAPSRGGEGRAVTSAPGHYVEPAFTPDGSKIVYRKVEGGYLRTPHYSFDPGVYVIPAAGGKAALVTKEGFEPQFGAANDRVFLITFGAEGKRELRSIELDGSDERIHATSAEATELAISPDGRWLAFTEQFNAWVLPFVATGQPVELAPKATAIPTSRVSRDAGEYIHWSGDSRKLY